jgi:hypothetical protein
VYNALLLCDQVKVTVASIFSFVIFTFREGHGKKVLVTLTVLDQLTPEKMGCTVKED